MSAADELRQRRLVERVYLLGPAPLLHLLRELEAGADLLSTLERYAALDPSFVGLLGGDRFVTPLHIVHNGEAA